MEILGIKNVLAIIVCTFFVSVSVSEGHVYKSSPVRHRHEFYRQRSRGTLKAIKDDRTDEEDIRLPTALKPTHQNIRLQPILEGNFSTFGSVAIDFDVIEETDAIEFHMVDIITNNQTIKVVDKSDPATELAFTSHIYNTTKEVYRGTLQDPLELEHSYTISLEFEGYLNEEHLNGFYRSVYQDENGQDEILGATDMEPTNARRAFPCFDEPAHKITFTLEMGRDSSRNSIANMPLNYTYPDATQPDLFWDVFSPTYPMSTYLIAFIVSDYVEVNRTTSDGRVRFGVWTRPEAIADADYALQHGPDILSFYEWYLNVSFPLPKIDMATVPDFISGAMENWGLITFKETLLYNDEESDAKNKMMVDLVMAHELAHMWFGDLVTMEWWNNIWLNEGFASYFEYLGTDAVSKDYNMLELYTIFDVQPALSVDSRESSHPVITDVNYPWEISSLFDTISYSKGNSVIGMMKNFLTEITFRPALTPYLNDHSYGTAVQDDLWEAMDRQALADGTLNSTLTVKEIMDTWTLQMGYPVVSVAINGDGSADLTQERFIRIPNPNSTDTHDYKWWIPLTWTSQDNPIFFREGVDDWMAPTESAKTITGLSTSATWHIFNVDQVFFYRVNYDTNNWNGLINQLNDDHLVLNHLSRAQLNDDAMKFARALPGRLSYNTALDINMYLRNEIEYVPWVAALENLEYLEQMFTNTTGYTNLKAFMLDILIPFYDYIGFDDSLTDPHLQQLSRAMVVEWACHLNYADCVTNATNLYAQWMASPDNNPIIPNVRLGVYCTGIANGGQAEYDFAYDRFLNTNVAHESEDLLDAMTCSRDSAILEQYLDSTYLTSDSDIRSMSEYKVWNGICENDDGNLVAWNYLNQNWDALAVYYGGSYSPLAGMAAEVTYEWNTQEELQTLKDFRTQRQDDLGSSVATIDNAIETIEKNIEWVDSYYDVIVQWLVDNGYSN